MASILSSQGKVIAAAMAAAVSGTVILLAFQFRLQKSFPLYQIPQPSQQLLRSCISSEGKKRDEKKKKKKKKVQFAQDVMDPRGEDDGGEELRREVKNRAVRLIGSNNSDPPAALNSATKLKKVGGGVRSKDHRVMPANRIALYNGILRDRFVHRLRFSY